MIENTRLHAKNAQGELVPVHPETNEGMVKMLSGRTLTEELSVNSTEIITGVVSSLDPTLETIKSSMDNTLLPVVSDIHSSISVDKNQLFLSNGTFTVPDGVSVIYVTACASGGDGGNALEVAPSGVGSPGGGGGGSGEWMIAIPIKVSPKEVINIITGVGNTVIKNFILLRGSDGGPPSDHKAGGVGGVGGTNGGSGGVHTSSGTNYSNGYGGGAGGSSPFGTAGNGGYGGDQSHPDGFDGQDATGYGSAGGGAGGGCGTSTSSVGGTTWGKGIDGGKAEGRRSATGGLKGVTGNASYAGATGKPGKGAPGFVLIQW